MTTTIIITIIGILILCLIAWTIYRQRSYQRKPFTTINTKSGGVIRLPRDDYFMFRKGDFVCFFDKDGKLVQDEITDVH